MVAMPVMFLGMPANPETGSEALYHSGGVLTTLTWIGARPRLDGAAGGTAELVDVEPVERGTLGDEVVDLRRGHLLVARWTLVSQLRVAEVVDEHHEDVRLLRGGGCWECKQDREKREHATGTGSQGSTAALQCAAVATAARSERCNINI